MFIALDVQFRTLKEQLRKKNIVYEIHWDSVFLLLKIKVGMCKVGMCKVGMCKVGMCKGAKKKKKKLKLIKTLKSA